jgi:hypothetical protein
MCVLWSHLYYSFQRRLNDKHDIVHFQQKHQYIHEGQPFILEGKILSYPPL